MECVVELMVLMAGYWAIRSIVLLRGGGALQGDSGFYGRVWSRFVETF